jgi:tetratricopeptide (TPR) repeat protein
MSVWEFLSGDVPGGAALLIGVLLGIWITGWLIYRMSPLLKLRRFLLAAGILSLMWISIYGYYWRKYPPKEEKNRIVIIPRLSDSFFSENNLSLYTAAQWFYWTLSEKVNLEKWLVSDPDWVLKIAIWDSLALPGYLEKVYRFYRADLAAEIHLSSAGKIVIQLKEKRTGGKQRHWSISPLYREILRVVDDVMGEVPNLRNNANRRFGIPWTAPERCWLNWAKLRLLRLRGKGNRPDQLKLQSHDCSDFAPLFLELAIAHLDSARILFHLGGYYQDHLAQAKAYLDAVPDSIFPHVRFRLLGEWAILFQNFSLAELYLKKSFHIWPDDDRLYIDLARLHPSRYTDLGFPGEASLYKQALRVNPGSPEARIAYADFLHAAQYYSKAEKVLLSLLRLFPGNYDVRFAYGRKLIQHRKLDAAENYFRKMVEEFSPEYWSELRFQIGVVSFYRGDLEGAEEIFTELARSGEAPNAYLYLAEIAEKKGARSQAITYLRRRIRLGLGPNDPYVREAAKKLRNLIREQNGGVKRP